MRILIIDDESNARGLLRSLIRDKYGDTVIFDEASSVDMGFNRIVQFKPDILFLDIKLKTQTGFDLLDRFEKIDFRIIFTTAYSEYAVKAFEYSATHYLLKPINVDQLEDAMARIISDSEEDNANNEKLKEAGKYYRQAYLEKIALPSIEGNEFVPIQDIIYCEASGAYTAIFFNDGSEKLISKSLGWFEDRLNSELFCRTHKKYIVNLNQVKSLIKGKTALLELSNNKRVGVSLTYKKYVLSRLDSRNGL